MQLSRGRGCRHTIGSSMTEKQRQLWRSDLPPQRNFAKSLSNKRSSKSTRRREESRWNPSPGSYSRGVIRATSTHTDARARRPASSSQKTRFSNPDEILPRAHSSLGFVWNERNTSRQYQPQGFDTVGYVRRHGSDAEIRIGRNGELTRDNFFSSYLKECKLQTQKEADELYSSSSDAETESDVFGDVEELQLSARNEQKQVPLCWEDQLQKSEPGTVKSPGQTPTRRVLLTYAKEQQHSLQYERLHGSRPIDRRNITLAQLSEGLKRLSVMVSWKDTCILHWVEVAHLRETQPATTDVHIPLSGETMQPDAESDCAASSGSEISELEHRESCSKELLPQLLLENCENESLCIWFKVPNGSPVLMEMPRLTFDVFVTEISVRQPSITAFMAVKVKRISGTVFVVHLCLQSHAGWAQFGRDSAETEVRISVVCCQPRIMLLSVKAKLGGSATLSLAIPTVMREGTELPARFFQKRTSYCNQEDDEDRTDIEALVRLFPDLKVLNFEDSSLESTPFASPTRQLRTPKKVAAARRPLYRPSRPNGENAPKTSYVAIVNRWLYPYMDELPVKSSISHVHMQHL